MQIVAFDPLAPLPEGVLAWDRLVAEGRERMQGVTDEALRASALQATPDQVATMLYTSGTTGDPKGVVLTHRNLFSNVEAVALAFGIEPTDSTLSFLPLSHVFQRMADYLLLSRGCTISYPHSMDTLGLDLRTVGPHRGGGGATRLREGARCGCFSGRCKGDAGAMGAEDRTGMDLGAAIWSCAEPPPAVGSPDR